MRAPLPATLVLASERPSDFQLGVCVALPVFLSRLPFLLPGYGMDPDAWRVVHSGWQLGTQGVYRPSRGPGFPVQELVVAALWRGGPLLLNGVTALLSAVAAACFALVLRRTLALRSWVCWLAGMTLACVPVVYVESTTSMDYLWALAALMASLYALVCERRVWAGLLFGVAIGCRITTAIYGLPLVFLAVAPADGRRTRNALAWIGPAAAVALLAYSMVLSQEPWSFNVRYFLDYQLGWISKLQIPPAKISLPRATLDVWGDVGCIALVLGALAAIVPGLRRSGGFQAALRSPLAWSSLIAIALGIALYFKLPHEPGYLIPIVPFVLLLFALLLRSQAFAGLCLALLPAVWIDWDAGTPRAGVLLQTQRARREDAQFIQRSLDELEALQRRAKVVAGHWYMMLEQQAHGPMVGQAEIVILVQNRTQVDAYLEGGFELYYLPGIERSNLASWRFNLKVHGFEPLFLLDQVPAR